MSKDLENIAKLIGLCSLISFTGAVVVIAVVSGGAMLYYYEPNTIIGVSEALLGLYGVCVGFYIIKKIFQSSE